MADKREQTMIHGFTKRILGAGVCSALIATPVLAEKAGQLVDINGMDAGGAENALMSRGFTFISSHNSSGGYTNSYWWDKGTDDCVAVEAYNNRIMSITDASDQDCGHHKGGDAAAAAGVVAGAAILGALLGGKSHHKEGRNYDREQTRQFDRGYTDGLHHAQYHNYDRSDAYAHGYEKGADERNANLKYHHRRGGYSQVAQYRDLIGARAAGGMSDLESRGFRQVDNFTSGNTRYSIQWRAPSRQCLQVIVANGRLENITDIQTHPKCGGDGSGSSAGSAQAVQYNDVVGRSGSRARDMLGNRGFKRVARFGDNNTRYSIMWRSQSRQCLQLMVVDGRAADVSDIGQHPGCR